MNKGPDAILETTNGKMTARQYFKTYLDYFRKDIEEVATDEEMKSLDELANGSKKFEVEIKPSHMIDAEYIKKYAGKTPEEFVAGFEPTGYAPRLVKDSVINPMKKIGKFTRETLEIGWGEIFFRFSYGANKTNIRVPLDSMEEYMTLEGKLSNFEGNLSQLYWLVNSSMGLV